MEWAKDYTLLRKLLSAIDEEYAKYLDLAVSIAKKGDVLVACDMLRDIEGWIKARGNEATAKLLRNMCKELWRMYGPQR